MEQTSDKTNEVFSCSKWIRENQLRAENVVDYFNISGFYQHHEPEEKIEYTVTDNENGFFVLKKIKKNAINPNEVDCKAVYYILKNRMYQCPSLGAVIDARLRNSLLHLTDSFKTLEQIENLDVNKNISTPVNEKKNKKLDAYNNTLSSLFSKYKPPQIPP